jgi:hypothetical protein
MSVLFITPEYARHLDWAWVRLWLAIGGGVKVQEMPPKYPTLFLESPRRDTMLS